MSAPSVVLDTNIVLDLFLFDDHRAHALRRGLVERRLRWLATAAMRDELARVLAYPKIAARLALRELRAGDVLEAFDRHAELVEAPPRATIACGDPDDQKFIDLAVARQACALSKDSEVLRMRKRLQALDADAQATWLPPPLIEPHEHA